MDSKLVGTCRATRDTSHLIKSYTNVYVSLKIIHPFKKTQKCDQLKKIPILFCPVACDTSTVLVASKTQHCLRNILFTQLFIFHCWPKYKHNYNIKIYKKYTKAILLLRVRYLPKQPLGIGDDIPRRKIELYVLMCF